MADLEFKTKGYFGGTYNAIGGFIKQINSDKNLFELSGLWNGEMYIKNLTTGQKDMLFDATHAKETYPLTRPIEEQDERESQRLWKEVTTAIKNKDQNTATDEKSRIEDMQRQEAARRADEGIDWRPRLFRAVQGGRGGSEEGEEDLDWIINAKIDAPTPEEQVKQILNIAAILPGQKPDRRFSIPRRNTNNSLKQVPSRQDPQPQDQQQQHLGSAANGNLIDLEPDSVVRQATSSAEHGVTGIQKEPPGSASNPGAPSKQLNEANLLDLSGDMHKLDIGNRRETKDFDDPHSPSLRRMDSETQDVDEFHDAES